MVISLNYLVALIVTRNYRKKRVIFPLRFGGRRKVHSKDIAQCFGNVALFVCCCALRVYLRTFVKQFLYSLGGVVLLNSNSHRITNVYRSVVI